MKSIKVCMKELVNVQKPEASDISKNFQFFADFIHELGMLKRVKHEGWRLAGVEFPDSVADHCLRAAQIGYILARLEKYGKPEEVCVIVLFHDIEECRTGDIHKVARRYVSKEGEKAVKDQTEKLGDIGSGIFGMWEAAEMRNTRAGIIAKDADLLEQAFTAREYMENGHASAQDWINNVSKALQTKSAKTLLAVLENSKSTDWWRGLKKLS
ncbi:MAG: HD domain-containing protein [Candidatus Aenigmarchaeota archaeon]|nr:HD domain-containing protein [Candidatus Aenigmarchaeota archaeon]